MNTFMNQFQKHDPTFEGLAIKSRGHRDRVMFDELLDCAGFFFENTSMTNEQMDILDAILDDASNIMVKEQVNVDELRKIVNEYLKSEKYTQDQKKILCFIIEEVLMKTENYDGFQYIHWKNGGWSEWYDSGRPENIRDYLGNEFDREY